MKDHIKEPPVLNEHKSNDILAQDDVYIVPVPRSTHTANGIILDNMKEKDVKPSATEENEAGPSNEATETSEATDGKKKKKKAKVDKKEEESKKKDKKKKGPSSAMVAAMQERLQKIKEEEERQRVCILKCYSSIIPNNIK